MFNPDKYFSSIFSIKNPSEFDQIAMNLFVWHYNENTIYRRFCDGIKKKTKQIKSIYEIPCLPVNLFRYHKILPQGYDCEIHFETSGTTGTDSGKHYVVSKKLYEKSIRYGFEYFYGDIKDYTILALLPGYLERSNSSLVYMVNDWIKLGKNCDSGFYLNQHEKLYNKLEQLQQNRQKTILIGVTYALLDFAEKYNINFPELILMETGGMKGKRETIDREDLHKILKKSFGVSNIHSEYGMTELLSQAYSKSDGIFACPPWLRVYVRDSNDPLSTPEKKRIGSVNIIDLANIFSCPFLATDDIAILHKNNTFEIIGRADFSSIRGCNTMIE